jgi:hypothetical protein
MLDEIRRIVAVEAHRRRSGQCPSCLYSLGTGEIFDIQSDADGFIDRTSGLAAFVSDGRILLSAGYRAIDLQLIDDVDFEGYDHNSGETFSGRAGGGASVTVYENATMDYFQYAVAAVPTKR